MRTMGSSRAVLCFEFVYNRYGWITIDGISCFFPEVGAARPTFRTIKPTRQFLSQSRGNLKQVGPIYFGVELDGGDKRW